MLAFSDPPGPVVWWQTPQAKASGMRPRATMVGNRMNCRMRLILPACGLVFELPINGRRVPSMEQRARIVFRFRDGLQHIWQSAYAALRGPPSSEHRLTT